MLEFYSHCYVLVPPGRSFRFVSRPCSALHFDSEMLQKSSLLVSPCVSVSLYMHLCYIMTVSSWLTINKFERTWKELVVAYLMRCPNVCIVLRFRKYSSITISKMCLKFLKMLKFVSILKFLYSGLLNAWSRRWQRFGRTCWLHLQSKRRHIPPLRRNLYLCQVLYCCQTELVLHLTQLNKVTPALRTCSSRK